MNINRVWVTGKDEAVNSMVRAELAKYFEVSEVKPDLVFSCGGDGSIHWTSKKFKKSYILPINFGATVGVMVDAQKEDLNSIIQKLREDPDRYFYVKEEMKVKGTYQNITLEGVNEIYFLRDNQFGSFFRIHIDGKMHPEYLEIRKSLEPDNKDTDVIELSDKDIMGDGLIACSPFGSTAYNYNAQGYIFNTPGIGITSLAATYANIFENTNSRKHCKRVNPIIVTDNSEIVVEFLKSQPSIFCADSTQFKIDISKGDEIVFRRSENNMYLLKQKK